MKGAIHRTVAILASAALLLGATACSEDDSGPDEFVQPTNISTPDVGVEDADNGDDAGDAGDEADTDVPVGDRCEDVECESGLRCVRGDCVPPDSKLACDEAVDLGTLASDDSQTVSGDTQGFVDTLDATCVDVVDGFSGPENAFRFEVESSALVTIELTSGVTNIPWAFSIHRGECGDDNEMTCTRAPNTQFVANPGEVYFILVQPATGVDTGTFELAIDLTPRDCAPGERTCDENSVEICNVEGSFACATTCAEGACEGDTCDSPIEINGAMTLSGATRALSSNYNFSDRPSCQSISTPGQDLVLLVPGLTSGQMLIVDASEGNDLDHAIFITRTCDASAECEASIDLGDRLEYEIEEDGDYFVFVDKVSGSLGDYQIGIDIQ